MGTAAYSPALHRSLKLLMHVTAETVMDSCGYRGDERRRYYRIDDDVALRYQIIPEATLPDVLTRFDSGYADKWTLASEFAYATSQMKQALEKIKPEMPEVARYLEELNKKIDTLMRLLATSEDDMPSYPTDRVNLSASGLAFDAPAQVPVGSTLEIKLLIFPSFVCFLSLGKVVRCSRENTEERDFPYRIAVDFTHIREGAREILVKHVLQKESSHLRKARSLPDSASNS